MIKITEEILNLNKMDIFDKYYWATESKDEAIQLLTHNEISRIDLTEYAFIMALTKYINGEKWR